MIRANQVFVEQDEAEVVTVAVHFPSVIRVLHKRLQILLADGDCGEHVA
jgi:hypothetical protein